MKQKNNYELRWWKTGLYFIIGLFMLAITIKAATATTWTQYIPSPTVTEIDQIYSLSTGYAFAILSDGSHQFIYNKTGWEEIIVPNASTLGNTTYLLGLDKTSTGLIIIAYSDGAAGRNVKTYEFNPATKSYTLKTTIYTPSSGVKSGTFGCDKNTNKCYFRSSTVNVSQAYPTNVNITNSLSYDISLRSNLRYWVASAAAMEYYNGVSWVSFTGLSLGTAPYTIMEINNNRVEAGVSVTTLRTNFYNVTSGTFHGLNMATTSKAPASTIVDDTTFFLTNNTKIFRCDFITETCTPETTTGNSLITMDYDFNSGIGWAAGSGGIIYVYNSSTSVPATYSLSVRADTNPSFQNTNTNFYATTMNTYASHTSNISITFYDDTGTDIYGWEWQNAPDGVEVSNLIDSIAWTNFPVGTYDVELNATDDGYNYAFASMTWEVITTAENESNVNYTWTTSNISGEYTNINALASAGDDNTYATANKNGTLIILGINHNNPNNPIVTEYLNVTDDMNAQELTSISTHQYRLYLGTDIALRIYNTTGTGNATNLTYIGGASWNQFEDYVRDVTAINDDYAWSCHHSPIPFVGDVEPLYNYTAADYDAYNLGINPCKSILYANDLVIIHSGVNNAYIFNSTSQNLLSTINLNGASGTSTQDLIDTYGNHLFLLTNYQTVTRYDITDPNNPTLNATCKTDRNIQSIEALNQNEVIIGASNKIAVCDFNNSHTYDNTINAYLPTTLKTLSIEEDTGSILEITANTPNKFTATTGNQIFIITYTRQNETTAENYPPTITSLTISDTTPCINQNIRIIINAQDYENDPLTYDFYCSGTHNNMINNYLNNEFYCQYAQTGTNTITAFTRDSHTTPTKYTTTITTSNCTANNTLFFTVLDKNTMTPIDGAIITLTNDGQTTTSDEEGKAYFSTNTASPWSITATHPDYYDFTQSGIMSTNFNLLMTPRTSTTGTTLIVTDYDAKTSNPLSGLIVSATDINTGQNLYAVTDDNGRAIITGMFSSELLKITTGSSEYINLGNTFTHITSHYGVQSIMTNIRTGETKYLTFNLTYLEGSYAFTRTNRSCMDFMLGEGGNSTGLFGVWLCGDLSLIGPGDTCNVDADCLSTKCSTYSHTCNHFNFTICDQYSNTPFSGMGRGNNCLVQATAFGMLRGITSTLLMYFLFFIVIVIIIILIVLLRRRK